MTSPKKCVASAIALCLAVAGCSHLNTTTASSKATSTPSKATALSGIDSQNFDRTVAHQDDFYLSVNGTWLAKTKIPADRSDYGSFSVLADNAQIALRQIIEQSASSPQVQGSEAQKVGDFYNTYMDQATINGKGLSPIQADLAAIDSLSSHQQIASYLGQQLLQGVSAPFGFHVNNDEKQSDRYIVYIHQSGLGLPDRDYYVKQDDKSANLRASYLTYLTDMLTLVDQPKASSAATAVLSLETQLAKLQWTRVASRDAEKSYNKLTQQQLRTLLGNFDFSAFADATHLDKVPEFVVNQPSYLQGLGELFTQIPVATWRAYLKVRLVNATAPYLTDELVTRQFEFYDKELSGVEQQKPRWKRAVSDIDSMLGEAVGKLYVAQNFKPEAKARMEVLVNNIIKAFEVSIKDLEWMTAETKVAALDKLSKFTAKIGYPEKWRDYSALQIVNGDLIGNIRRASRFEYADMLAKLGKPIDKAEWHMTPQTVNAYYNPVNNEIVFPAAILQPPFFNMQADDAVNYGAIGAVIGHEISHGFDDQGSKYDGNGNLRNWWSDADKQAFEARTKQLVAQYDTYYPFADAHVNGAFTLGENIGDLGGLTVAYKALKLSLNESNNRVIDGFTPEQRFFIGWSQVWRRNYREPALRQRLVVDPHSPSHYRVIGIVPNLPGFYDAFNVKEGDKMYIAPEKRVKIW